MSFSGSVGYADFSGSNGSSRPSGCSRVRQASPRLATGAGALLAQPALHLGAVARIWQLIGVDKRQSRSSRQQATSADNLIFLLLRL